jgi:hypothetical protein
LGACWNYHRSHLPEVATLRNFALSDIFRAFHSPSGVHFEGRVLALLCALSLVSCATGKTVPLSGGLTRAGVIKVIGNPDGFQRSGDYEALHYVERQINGWLLTRSCRA